MSPFALMAEFQKLLRDAQARTGDKTLSTCVGAGTVQICRVTFDAKGKSTVTPVTDYLPIDDAREYLKRMAA